MNLVRAFLLLCLGAQLCAAEATPVAVQDVLIRASMAKEVDPQTKKPKEIITVFPSTQSVFYAVLTFKDAPSDTPLRVLWLTADNATLADYHTTVTGSRTASIAFHPKQGELPPGAYRVEVYLNNELARTLDFRVTQDDAVPAKPAISSNFIVNIVMAKKVIQPGNLPQDPTYDFAPDDSFHLVVEVRDAPKDTTYKATWYGDKIQGLEPNYYMAEAESIITGSKNLDFALKPSNPWPAGTYRVEIRENKQLAATIKFTVTQRSVSRAGKSPGLLSLGQSEATADDPDEQP